MNPKIKHHCNECVFLLKHHFLDKNLLHGVLYICKVKELVIEDKDKCSCNLFLDKETPFQSGENY